MQIHRVRGNDLKEALQRARRNYGEGALVISHERSEDGGVTLAVAQRPVSSTEALTSVAEEVAKTTAVDLSAYEDVKKRLRQTGCTSEWTDQVIRRAAQEAAQGQHPMDRFGEYIGGEFRIAHLPNTPGVTRIVAFVGNTGVGKTTGLVKLGARFARAHRLLGMATLDSRRVGAAEQLRAYSDLLGAPMRGLNSEQALNADVLGTTGKDVVLLDTTGRPASDEPQLRKLHTELQAKDSRAALDTFLVLPASASRSALREVTEAFGDLRLSGCVITKVDETRQPAPVLEHVLELGLPVAFISDGQDLGLNFRRATPGLLADLLLLGRTE